ncbi:MAG: acyltransferase family protein [Thermoleophilia bacterium]|nr:acyltransferase family protein [Thermoleophilia bacterium]
MEPVPEVDISTAARMLSVLNPRRLYHRAELECAERLPVDGGVVVVSNHGRLDFDCFILAGLILRSRGRLVRLLADHLWFKVPGVGRMWSMAGAVDGTRENAARLLERGEMVLAYPGGVREIMGSRYGHEHIDWSGRTGFAQVAISASVPVLPVAGVGVNNGFFFATSGRLLGRLLFRGVLRMGPAYGGYRDPLTIGLVPLPLPFSLAIHLPLPCKVRYVVGEPIYPGTVSSEDGAVEEAAAELATRVAEAVKRLIQEHGRP